MEKLIQFKSHSSESPFLYKIGGASSTSFEKTAESKQIHQTIADYISGAQDIPGKTQVLLVALGAGEFYGANVNGDFFPENSLKNPTEHYGYKTFEKYAYAYKHHVNKDPAKSYGKVVLSVWNDQMKRVELIVVIENDKAPDIVERINNNEVIETSMGCLKASAKVLMADFSEKDISRVLSGDKVINALGEESIVLEPHSHEHTGIWVRPTILGLPNVEPTTEDHPWYILPKEQVVCRGNKVLRRKQTKCTPNSIFKKGCEGCSFINELKLEGQWVKAIDLREGDFVGTPILKKTTDIKIDPKYSSLLGLYLAEGYITPDGYASFIVHSDEEPLILEEFKDSYTFISRDHQESTFAKNITIYDKVLAKRLMKDARKMSHYKLLSSEVMSWDIESQKILLGSYLNGDGGVYKGSAYFSTCNKVLAKQIQMLLLRVGIISSLNTNLHKPSKLVKKETIEYQVWCGTNTSNILGKYTRKKGIRDSINLSESRFIAVGYLWSPIKNISTEECAEKVFNISIDSGKYDSDSYLINGISLHNCKVPYDVCSICGNKAKTRAQYCNHLRMYMNKIPPGETKRACAINTLPRFFDISFVLMGADRISAVIKKITGNNSGQQWGSLKVASLKRAVSDPMREIPGSFSKIASIEDDFIKTAFGLTKEKIAARKIAEIDKEVTPNLNPELVSKIEDHALQSSKLLQDNSPDIPRHILIRISSRGKPGMSSINKLMSTLSILGIVPKPHEFQDMVLNSLNLGALGEKLHHNQVVFNPDSPISNDEMCSCRDHLDLSPENFDEQVYKDISPWIQERSFFRPILKKRVIHIVKLAEANNLEYHKEDLSGIKNESGGSVGPVAVMATLVGLYSVLGDHAAKVHESGLDKILLKHPYMAIALGAGVLSGITSLTEKHTMGKYDYEPTIGSIYNPNISWEDQERNKNMNPLMKTGGVASRIILGVPSMYMASGYQTVKKLRDPRRQENFVGRFVRKHPDLASAMYVGEAMAGYPITKKIKAGLSMLRKTASFGDDLKSTAIYSLAFPGKSLALSAANMAVDTAVIRGMGKLLTYKKRKQKGGYHGKY